MKKMSTFWRLSTLLLVGILTLVVAGCGGGKAGDDKKTLIYATASDAVKLDPQMMTDVPSYNMTNHKIYETLVDLDKDGKFKPYLATEWKNIDPVTWEFKLQKNVKFHDGTPMNAAAVKKTFERLMDPKEKKAQQQMLQAVKEIKVIDDTTLQIITKEPSPTLLQSLTHNSTAIISPKSIDDHKNKSLDQNPVGTGPYKLEKWTKGESMTLALFPEYWGKKPTVEILVFKVVPEDATRMGMLKSGEAHIADKLPFNDVDTYAKDTKLQVIRTQGYGTEFLGFNLKKDIFKDVRVRQAIDLAIDREAIRMGVYKGIGDAGVSSLAPKVFGHNPNLPKAEYNLEKAKALLAEAGVTNLSFTLWTSTNNKARIKVAEIVQDQLKKAGINVTIKTLEWGVFLKAYQDGETDMYILGWSNSTGDAEYSMRIWSESGFGTINGSFYSTPEMETLLDQGSKEMDREKRLKIYWKAQEVATNSHARLIYRTTDYVSLASAKVKGIYFTPGEILLPETLTIE